MPIIKSAKKRMKQNLVRRELNFPIRSKLKTVIKQALTLIKEGKYDEAVAYMPRAYSTIDTAEKKNIIKKNNAARKKSRIARALNELQEKSGKSAAKATKAPAKAKEEDKKEA